MYQRFYTSSDIQLWLSNSTIGANSIKLDTAISISYSLQQTSSPIYSLGSRHAQFFSHGNTIGVGTLTLAFTDEEYFKACVDYVGGKNLDYHYSDPTGLYNNVETPTPVEATFSSAKINKITNADLRASKRKSTQSATNVTSAYHRLISIGSIRAVFDILLYINNESAIEASDSKVIRLRDVKIVGDSLSSDSIHDAPLTITYKFLFKDVIRG